MRHLTAFLLLLPVVASSQVVSLVTGPDFVPYVDSKNPDNGLASEIVIAAFAADGRKVNVEIRPWARALHETKEAGFQASFPYTKTPEREAAYHYSAPVLFVRHRIFVKAGNAKLNSRDLNSLAGSNYCVPNGRAVNPRLVEMVASGFINKETPPGTANCLQMLAAGRVDFLVGDEKEARAQMLASGVEIGTVVMAEGPPLTELPLHVIAGKGVAGSEEIIKGFNSGLAKIQKNGAYARIQKSYQN